MSWPLMGVSVSSPNRTREPSPVQLAMSASSSDMRSRGVPEVADAHPPAEEEKLLHQPIEVDRGFDAERRPAEPVGAGEGVFSRLQHRRLYIETGVEAALDLRQSRIFARRTREAVPPRVTSSATTHRVPPRRATGVACRRRGRLGRTARRRPGSVPGAETRFEEGENPRTPCWSRVGREGARMDGDVEAAPLELPRGGEADGAGSDDGACREA